MGSRFQRFEKPEAGKPRAQDQQAPGLKPQLIRGGVRGVETPR